jgi:2-polyprenyl-3-methyl-5-hydroxy-6-metoxy-1,4-benzoquinol methylase
MFNKDGCLKTNSSPHSPHQIISKEIVPHTTILDVGCNSGMIGKILCKTNTLDGIDINKTALKKAKKYYRHLFCLDLADVNNLKITNKYDYIIFSDVLEHLPRPDLLLLKMKKRLNNGGLIICSLPNIARFEVRLNLLLGKFNYTDSGILNQDHLRFFTRESAQLLFSQNGYQVLKIIPTGLGHQTGMLPTLTAFQFIFIAAINHD